MHFDANRDWNSTIKINLELATKSLISVWWIVNWKHQWSSSAFGFETLSSKNFSGLVTQIRFCAIPSQNWQLLSKKGLPSSKLVSEKNGKKYPEPNILLKKSCEKVFRCHLFLERVCGRLVFGLGLWIKDLLSST